jgi:hypothetical protein
MTWPPGDFVSSIAAAGDDDDDDAMDVEAPVKRRQFTAPAAAMREVGWQHVALAPNTTFQTTPCSIREHTTQQIFTTQDSDLQHAKQLCQPLFFSFSFFSFTVVIGDRWPHWLDLVKWEDGCACQAAAMAIWLQSFDVVKREDGCVCQAAAMAAWLQSFDVVEWEDGCVCQAAAMAIWLQSFDNIAAQMTRWLVGFAMVTWDIGTTVASNSV